MDATGGRAAPAVPASDGTEPRSLPATDDRAAGRLRPWELVALIVILVAAAAVRFVALPTRGRFDADQGHEMLVLHDLVTSGVIPLLGPPTSVGAGHHGAIYYYLLAPAAFVNGASDPIPVLALIALCGLAAIALTWWLARSIGGPVAGLVAAAVLAISGTAIGTSTLLWNPSPMPAASALAFVGARSAWRDGSPAWWLVAGAGAMVTMQLHVLGALLVPPLAALWVAALVRAGRPDASGRARATRRAIALAGLGAAAILAAGYLPLAVHEAGGGFTETRAILDYLLSGGGSTEMGLATRLIGALVRTVAWPLTGALADAPAAAVLATCAFACVVVWRLVRARGDERAMVAWLAGTVAFEAVAMAVVFPSAVVITPLPTDHYNAWLDPAIAALVGIGTASLVGRAVAAGPMPVRALAGGTAVVLLGSLAAWNLSHVPPAISPDGDWIGVRSTADRIAAEAGDGSIGFVTLPSFKSADAYAYPLTVDGRAPVASSDAATVVVLCEALWVDDCGGPAEERALRTEAGGGGFTLRSRLEPAPGRTLSIYARTTGP